ncbi:receptor-like protein kinase HSL1 [Mangifera indica]|uniref:receptor-like protein kinase HSL1 n=1 Tax=Mangifera indica TaxID=29780 RepID=UPI001CFBD9ED|nr:receptor-like protein kinase HSL1 [Mangifera indica]
MFNFTTISIAILLCTFLFIFNRYAIANPQLYDEEHALLMKLKQNWQNPPSIAHWNPSNTNHCSWPEITCTRNSITGLFLYNTSISQSVPSFICDLKNLAHLDLHYNYLSGLFPTVLYNCSKLQHLDLSENFIVGPIPHDIDSLSQLRYLSLASNNFSFDIPATIGNITELRVLELPQNQFNGSFPSDIGNLKNLEQLELSRNAKFVPSKLSSNFSQLRNLKSLLMAEANLIGEIPESVGNMTALETLDLSSNGLTGKIPNCIFMLKNLSRLFLDRNKLSAEIPQVVQSLNLTVIDLSQNNLIGTIPNDFGKLENLERLILMYNQLSGEIPEKVGGIPSLIDVRLFSNQLSGALPLNFGRYSALTRFEVASNNFTGKLPEHLCAGGKLLGLIAFDNNLSGELPESLGNCNSLLRIRIHNNSFSGKIPVGLWTASNLSDVLINDNMFTGELPENFSGNLSSVDISNNKFSGKIPAGVSSWRNLQVFKASNNLLTGTVPRELTLLPSLTILWLDRNNLSGSIPSNLTAWKKLTFLNLSRNQLSGEIPEEIGSLTVLNNLDLAENKFSGKIPRQLGLLKLTCLNLSSNLLIGEIPSEFENGAYASSFANNPGLCARSSFVNIKICSFQPEKSREVSSKYLALLISAASVVFLLALIFSLFMFRAYGKRKLRTNTMDSKITKFHYLNVTENVIRSNLIENNVIGSGGSGKVYCVPVNSLGDVVAVKMIGNSQKLDQEQEKQFLAEVQTLGRIRHLNIVKLLCCISSENLKLLVYEYLENRSLDLWLHKRNHPSIPAGSGFGYGSADNFALDWPKRMQIAVGTAKGLCYMHHCCCPPIVHRDVKSSNILLDSEFNPKIGDFGLAKTLVKRGELETMSSVVGSFGYIAPEYAYTTRVNEKTDIYSFGVILLELTTGREANYGDEHTYLAKWAWQHLQDGNPIVDVLDEEIKEACYLDEMTRVFKLGICCTRTPPAARPSMKSVLEMLVNPPVTLHDKTINT